MALVFYLSGILLGDLDVAIKQCLIFPRDYSAADTVLPKNLKFEAEVWK